MIRCIAGTLLTLFLSPHAALAQETRAPAAPGIPPRATIFVLDKQGTEHSGRFLRFDDQELVMLVGVDERRMRRDVITRIERSGDSLKNGAIIGTLIGGALGVFGSALWADDLEEWITGIAVNAGAYAAIGIALDAAVQGRTVVYHDWPAPVRKRSAAALAFSVSW